jgi:hypothetical protein
MNIGTWRALNWSTAGVQLPASAFNYPLVSAPGNGSPMAATLSATGQKIISYDPILCGTMGADAAFFVLLHEVGHHYHQHLNVVVPTDFRRAGIVKGLETQADEYACADLIDSYPNDAPAIYRAAHGYFVTNNSQGGGTHPPDRERASNMEIQWTARCAVCRVRITMGNSAISHVSARTTLAALNVPVFGAGNQDQQMTAMEAGGTFISEAFTYGNALKRLDQIRVSRMFSGETNDPNLTIVRA